MDENILSAELVKSSFLAPPQERDKLQPESRAVKVLDHLDAGSGPA